MQGPGSTRKGALQNRQGGVREKEPSADGSLRAEGQAPVGNGQAPRALAMRLGPLKFERGRAERRNSAECKWVSEHHEMCRQQHWGWAMQKRQSSRTRFLDQEMVMVAGAGALIFHWLVTAYRVIRSHNLPTLLAWIAVSRSSGTLTRSYSARMRLWVSRTAIVRYERDKRKHSCSSPPRVAC
jgi:hypothetical protein